MVVTRTAQQLMNTVFPQQRWIIPDVLPEGLTLLAGSPKAGKSWMMLDLLLATAMGGMALGSFSATAGEAVYLALEDSFRRLQDRLRLLLDGEAPAGLHLITEWQRLDQGGVEALDQWLSEHPHVRLVVIDTLQKVRPPQKPQGNIYAEDYASVAGLKALAERHNVAIVLVHHLRKAKGRDPLERVSGSTGLTGVVDAVWIMERQRGAQTAKLFVTGRDVVEQELQLTWDEDTARWSASCAARPPERSQARQAILDALTEAGGPMTPAKLAEKLGRDRNPVKAMMWKMQNSGELTVDAQGRYSVVSNQLPH